LLGATLNQGNIYRNHKLWNIGSTEIYTPYAGATGIFYFEADPDYFSWVDVPFPFWNVVCENFITICSLYFQLPKTTNNI
jgi:hypothetical protein